MRHGKKEAPATCDVTGCKEEKKRSLSRKNVSNATDLSLEGEGRKVNLCKEHYKEYKKATKKDREIERAGW